MPIECEYILLLSAINASPHIDKKNLAGKKMYERGKNCTEGKHTMKKGNKSLI